MPRCDAFDLADSSDTELVAVRPTTQTVVNKLSKVPFPRSSLVYHRNVPSMRQYVRGNLLKKIFVDSDGRARREAIPQRTVFDPQRNPTAHRTEYEQPWRY